MSWATRSIGEKNIMDIPMKHKRPLIAVQSGSRPWGAGANSSWTDSFLRSMC